MSFIPLKVFRRDSDTSAVANNEPDQLSTNPFGRLKVSTWHGAFDVTTGTITANAQTVAADVSRAGSATVTISGTYAGVNMTFEAFDGVNWIAIPAQPVSLTNTQLVATGVMTANSTLAWDVSPILGFQQLRVRATAYTSGTANIRILPADGVVEYAAQVNGTVAIASGTVTTVSTLTSVTNGVRAAVNTTAGGATTFTLVSAASTNGQLISTAAARTLYGVQAFNNGAAVAYVKIYANATAPTVGTTVPVMTFAIPAGGGFIYTAPPQGLAIAAGLGVAITGGNTTADTTAVAANQVNLNVQYA